MHVGNGDALICGKSRWIGTVICLFQPNEERGSGAQAMADDGLYEKIPNPDVILGKESSH